MQSKRYKKEIKDFGDRLRQLRIERGFTQLELEGATGIDAGDISRIERGKLDIQFSRIVRLADGLEVPIDKLFCKI